MSDQAWQALGKSNLGFMDSLSSSMSQLEQKDKGAFTDIRTGPTLLIASDYAGERREDLASSYSFIAIDAQYLWLWDEMWGKVRSSILPDNRRFAFKKLSDQIRQKALLPFLKSANCIPGVLVTYVFHKNVGQLFDEEESDWKADWKQAQFEKLMRIAHLFSMTVSCLSRSGQEVMWITDNDAIMANEKKQKQTRSVVMHFLNHYLKHPVSWTRFGTPNDLASEDLLAICDMSCGYIGELAGALFAAVGQKCSHSILWQADIQNKTRAFMDWYMDDLKHTLKRITVLIWRDPDDSLRHTCIHFAGRSNPAFYWHEDFMRVFGISSPNSNQGEGIH
jgi:hypothetical protein